MIELLIGLALILCIFLNILASRYGYSNILTGDKDILLPFSAMIFLFFPLLIYLPETNYKFLNYEETGNIQTLQAEQQQQQQAFPWAFLLTLFSITLSIILHRLVLFQNVQSQEEALNRRANNQANEVNQGNQAVNSQSGGSSRAMSSSTALFKNVEYKIESLILKYYLSIAIGLQNIVTAFYITSNQPKRFVQNQLIIFGIFSLVINFSYGYINGWSAVSKDLSDRLTVFINLGIILGYLLGLVVQNNLIIVSLPCFCCGLMIYCSTMICLPNLYSNGENHNQDKFRYGSIFTALLLTVVYHPLCYLLRV